MATISCPFTYYDLPWASEDDESAGTRTVTGYYVDLL